MATVIDESPTREKIMVLIKKGGGMTVEELSRNIGITPMGVRQHLMSLEKKGMIRYERKKHGIGRPVFIYRLTDRAEDFFPKTYSSLLSSLLKVFEETYGRNKVDELFRLRTERLLRERKNALSGKTELREKVFLLAGLLEADGYLVEIDENDRCYIFRNFNCPISKIASEYREACKYELEMFRELLSKNSVRTECIAEGAFSCTFNIPKA